MSLLVWIPMIHGDCKDQGLLGVETSVINTVTYVDGKLGKAAQIGNGNQVTNGIQINTNLVEELGTQYSCSVWIKPLGNHVHYEGAIISSGNWNNKCWAFGVNQNNTAVDVFRGGCNRYVACPVPVNQWTHLVSVNDGVYVNLYKNGELVSTANASSWPLDSDATNTTIGRETYANGYFSFNGCVQDLRIYDHALSPLEVKHLAQGLVLHYPLNREGLGATNLLKNGFGELNRENWSNSNVYTDVPSGHAEIKKSYRDNESLEYIPLVRNCTYKFSCWIKAAYSSGYSYPSLKPYDADKLFINTNNCKEGFNLSTMTTLKQQLNPGDTKIYVDDLSAWNANSGHYYDTAAIFSYTDGQGYTWPDGTYTRNCPAFSSGTEAKTNLDKTNNIITLLSAYTGPIMPVGTKVCASTYGSTFFYPLGGISNSTISDWTYKEGIFSSQHSRLECAKYIRVYAYSSCYQAGMTLSNQTLEDMTNNIEYDCSGYGNNGTRVGTFSWSGDTPRYGTSSVFSGNQYIVEPNEIITTDSTIALWIKSSLNGNAFALDARNNSGIGKQPIYQYTSGGIQTGGNAKYVTSSSGLLVANTWVHVVLVQNGNSLLIYKNGDLFQTISCENSSVIKPTLGARYSFTGKYTGQLSDLRIYATALSPEDVRDLYAVGASLSNTGVLFSNEVSEL